MNKAVHHAHHNIAAKQKPEVQKKGQDTVLFILVGAFLLGAVIGCVLAGKFVPNNLEGLLRQALEAKTQPSLWRELWAVFRWPAAALILGLLPLAGLTLPGVFFLRGLFLGYAIQVVAGSMTAHSFLWAAVLFGPTCLLAVPAFFVLGCIGLFGTAAQTPKRMKLLLGGAVCCVPLAACVVLDRTVVRTLLDILLAASAAT